MSPRRKRTLRFAVSGVVLLAFLAGLEPGRTIIVQGAATARAELLRRREVEE